MRKVALFLVVSLFVLLCGTGCSSISYKSSLQKFSGEAVVIKNVPFYPQQSQQCGPAALATVLNYHHIRVTPERLKPFVFLSGRSGTLQADLVATARRYGTVPYPLAPSLDALLTEVSAGNPVLVLQNLAFDWWPQWHYAVVIGFDAVQQQIVLHSGNNPYYRQELRTFVKTWHRASNWGLVVLPPGKAPVSLDTNKIVAELFKLETVREDIALEGYKRLAELQPRQALYFIALGNLLYGQKRFPEAIEAYQQGLRHSKYHPLLLNNLAYSYRALGCIFLARTTLKRGLGFNPGHQSLLKSLKESKTWSINDLSINNPEGCTRKLD